MEAARLLASAHPLLVHFPIVLLLLAVAIDVAAWWRRDERLSWCGYWLTLLGTLGAVVAFVCGIMAEVHAARAGVPQGPIEEHELLATFATWTFLALAVARILLGVTPRRRAMPVYLLVGLAGCVLLVLAAHRGGQAVYNYGANVGGVQLQRLMSDEDLAQLAQHQDEVTLQYSNQMHWIFGAIVIVLGLSILLERLPQKYGRLRALRRVVPFLFIGGGIYLVIYSDWDSWPLSNLRPITDAEVLLHKFIALMLIVMGSLQLRRPRDLEAAPSVWQNRIIAIMAAIGGGLLFTHVHTNAPYTNVALGVYLNHSALGLVSLAVAGTMLAADRYPDSRRLALLFPILLLVEGGMLASYNEDLPWFLGYHRILNRAPHHGVLAHVEGGRAELVFDKTSGTLDVYLLGSHDDAPRPIAAERLCASVDARQHPFPLIFTKVGDGRYQAHAEWLRGVPVFTVALCSPIVASFDPVVTAPLLPPLEGAEKVYGCAMCVDVLSSIPGTCPMCGMALAELPQRTLVAPRLPPHDERYDVRLEAGRPTAGKTATLRFAPRHADGTPVTDLREFHEKLMHLIVVSRDLRTFEHLHPEKQPDGTLTLDHAFAGGGKWVLFAEIAPEGSRPQRFRFEVDVAGGPASAAPPSDELVQQIGDYTVWLDARDGLRAGADNQLTFTIFDKGRAVDDLGTWLGAVGHCVIISEDTQDFVHAHALQLAAAQTPAGPQVAFHAQFPKPGRYRVWGQFSHRGQVLTADFAVSVR